MRPTVFAAVVLTALSSGLSSSAGAAEKLTVRLDWLPHGMHAPFHLATERGWFKEKGLDVSIQDGNGSVVTVQLVGAGQFDIGHANLASMAMAREKGLKVKAIAGFVRKSDMGVLVPKGSGIRTVKDLIGKKVIYTAGSLESPFLGAFCKAGGVDRSKVDLISVAASAKVSTYVSKRGDAVISTVPYFLPIVAHSRPSNSILFADYGLPLPGFGLLAREETIESKPKQLRAFVGIIIRGWKYILDGHEKEGVQAIIDARPQAKLNPAVLLGQIEQYKKYFYTDATRGKPIGWMSPKDWAETLKAMQEAGVVSKNVKPTDLFTNRFIPKS